MMFRNILFLISTFPCINHSQGLSSFDLSLKIVKDNQITDDVVFYHIYYDYDSNNLIKKCDVSRYRLNNISCKKNNSSYFSSPELFSNQMSSSKLSCELNREEKIEKVNINLENGFEISKFSVTYDKKILESRNFSGGSIISFPNSEIINLSFVPFQNKSGYSDLKISCGKISVKNIVSENK